MSLFALFQALFAITVALISGAVADRMKFSSWMVFAGLWAVLVYFPLQLGVRVRRRRHRDSRRRLDRQQPSGRWLRGWHRGAHQRRSGGPGHWRSFWASPWSWGGDRKPHNVPLTLLGAGMLWAGWYAFNGGSALAAGNSAAIVMVTTSVATRAATPAWLVVEKFRNTYALASGCGVGRHHRLVAITPGLRAPSTIGHDRPRCDCRRIRPTPCLRASWATTPWMLVKSTRRRDCTLMIGFPGKRFHAERDQRSVHDGGGSASFCGRGHRRGRGHRLLFIVAFVIAYVLKLTMGIRVAPEDGGRASGRSTATARMSSSSRDDDAAATAEESRHRFA